MPVPVGEDLMDLQRAADLVGMSVEGVAKKVRVGRVPAERIGHKWFIRKRDVAAMVAMRSPVGVLDQIGTAYPVVAILAREDFVTAEELATRIGRPRRTVLDWLQRLDREGLVTRHDGDHPRDPDRCQLTEKGRALYGEEIAIRANRGL